MMGDIAKGAAWMVLFRLFDRSIGLVSTALLARLLLPADYGLVAMAMSVIAVIELATAFSFEIALIQKPEPRRAHYDTAWTLNILVAAGGAAATAALAVPTAAFYGDPRLTPVMLAIGVGWFFSGFENVGIVDFRRRMDFKAEFRFLAYKRMMAFVAVVIAALTLRSYWALVIGMITGRLAGLVLSYAMQPLRPRPSLECARELFSFSGWLLANNVALVALGRLPHYVVGKAFGAQALGAYSVGFEISQLAHTELVAPINRAMFPGYSRIAGDMDLFRTTWIDANALIALITLPVAVGVATLAAPFVLTLLGPNWVDAIPVIRVLAFACVAITLTSNTFNAWIALARNNLPTIVLLVRLATLVVAGYMLVGDGGHGLLGVAYAELIGALGGLLVALPMMLSSLSVPVRSYLRGLWRPVIATGVMALGVHEVLVVMGDAEGFAGAVAQLTIGSLVGAVVYTGALLLLWQLVGRPQSIEAHLLAKVHSMIAHWRRKSA
jgi:lipopolysaccharide exporter